MNMMRKNNNRGGNKHRGGGNRRYNNNGGGGNSRPNDSQNLQRQKHHATQQLAKYSDLARNAQNNGDRVDVEYYLQHVDHYTRVLTDIAAIEAERFAHQRESQIIPGGPNDPNAQAAQNGGSSDESTGSEASGSAGGDANAAEVAGENNPSQPRQQRQRRPYQQPSDNGAKEANSNTTEIPLPGSILPPI
jgi:uncharacterized protein YfcZ (UPF0381/DUF406 family)